MEDSNNLLSDELYSCFRMTMLSQIKPSSPIALRLIELGEELSIEKHSNCSRVIFDMETGDPDDILSLYLLLGHPSIEIVAVTIHPGTPDQIGLVREVLADMHAPGIPVGYHNIDHGKLCVSRWYYKNGFQVVPSTEAVPAGQLILDLTTPVTTIITGGPLTNIASAIRLGQQQSKPLHPLKLTIQGGYAGCNIVPDTDALSKFRGLVAQSTYNLGGNGAAAYTVLSQIPKVPKYFVSKNVCHGIIYGEKLANQLIERCRAKPSKHLVRIYNLLEHYHAHGVQKKLHDPFAVCCAICPDIVEWKQVHMYSTRGAWRSEEVPSLATDSNKDGSVVTTLEPFPPRVSAVRVGEHDEEEEMKTGDEICRVPVYPKDSRDNMTWISVKLRSHDAFVDTFFS
jgi:inosine-uridine nucleoside N-ribohydrolase